MRVENNISLKHFNTFGIDVYALHFVEISSLQDIQELSQNTAIWSQRKLILGGGSNILFLQDFKGLVIQVNLKGIECIEENGFVFLKVMAGEEWHDVVSKSLDFDLFGIENLSLIPGKSGAAPIQNIGAYGVELKDVFHELEAFHLENSELRTFSKEECRFGYRDSCFKQEEKGKWLILSITLKLSKEGEVKTSYGAIQEVLKERKIVNPSPRDVSEAVISIRQSKLPNPKVLGNAGSFFKNPEISKEHFQALAQTWNDLPSFPVSGETVKVPAAYLIEKCNWKGKRVGNVGSHIQQPLVLVNYGNASGVEIKNLALEIIESVKYVFNIILEPEVNFV